VPTPNIDSIAHNGVVFTSGYVTCPVCAPSRAGLLTGRYQQRFGFYTNFSRTRPLPNAVQSIPASVRQMSEYLKPLGYRTAFIGKQHEPPDEDSHPNNRGWDFFFGFQGGSSDYYLESEVTSKPLWRNRKIVAEENAYLTDAFGREAVAFIEQNHDRPFLLYLPFNAIHPPLQAPEEMVAKHARLEPRARRMAAAMLESLDANVGRVLDALRAPGVMGNTLVVFLSDNGGGSSSPSKPFRGAKGTGWEGGLRVPFCMRWDGHVKPETRDNRPIVTLDLVPTFIKAAGGEIDPAWGLDGVDLMPFLTGERSGRPHQEIYCDWGGWNVLRAGDWKLIRHDGPWQLYDLADDPAEADNLAVKHPEKVEDLQDKWMTWRAQILESQRAGVSGNEPEPAAHAPPPHEATPSPKGRRDEEGPAPGRGT